jgi:CBS domain containing-hemolysin-like protein
VYRWIIKITVFAILVSTVFTFVSSNALGNAGYALAIGALVLFIAIGVAFDIVGVAVTAAREAPFHAMASHHERGAREVLALLRNANKVSSVCNDVVGDIAGIVSGTTAALVAGRIAAGGGASELAAQLIVSGVVTGLTIGGKAIGKTFAMSYTTEILLRVGRFISIFNKRSAKKR